MGAFLMLAADVRFGVAGPWRIGLNETAIGITVPKFAVELARHRLTPPGFARIQSAALFGPEEARRLRAPAAPSFVATKSRINERALHAVRSAIEEEMRAAA